MKAIIAGAGITGLSAANFLSANGWDVLLLERAPGPRPEGYIIDFFGPGWAAARRMGVLDRIKELGYRVTTIDYVDDLGKARVSLGYESFSKVVGDRLSSILRPDLEQAIREALPEHVRLDYATTIARLNQTAEAVCVTLDDGRQLEADLLIGADGIHSDTRAMVFGPEQDYFTFLGFHVGAFNFSDPSVQAQLDGRYTITDTAQRALFFYQLRDGQLSVMGIHRTRNPQRPEDQQAEFRRRHQGLGWLGPAALEHVPERFYYDQVAQIRMPRWHEGRVVLLGDAAAAVSLLAGQGASLGMAGAEVLSQELERAADVPTALAAYEDRWRPQVEEYQQRGQNAANWFVPADRKGLWLRRMFLRLTRVPGVSKLISGNVVGKTGAAL